MDLWPTYTRKDIEQVLSALITGSFESPAYLKHNESIKPLIKNFDCELIYQAYYAATGDCLRNKKKNKNFPFGGPHGEKRNHNGNRR